MSEVTFYKTPFDKYEKPFIPIEGGFGFYGVLEMDEDGKAKCVECGKSFGLISGSHLMSKHGISTKEYKLKYGYLSGTVLASENFRIKMIDNGMKQFGSMEKSKLRKISKLAAIKSNHSKKIRNSRSSAEWKNLNGVCQGQIKKKFIDMVKKDGYVKSSSYLLKSKIFKERQIIEYIYKYWGSYKSFLSLLGYPNDKYLTLHMSKELGEKKEIINNLKIFYKENERTPTDSDCRRGLFPFSRHKIEKWGGIKVLSRIANIPHILPLKYNPKYLIDLLIDYPKKYGHCSTLSGYTKRYHISQSAIENIFGSWNNFLRAAGLPTWNERRKVA